MRIALADRQRLRAVLEAHLGAAAQVAHHAGDGAHVDDGGTVDLPEARRVELVAELLDRLADQRLAILGEHARVLAVGAEVADVVDRDDAHRLALRRVDPAQESLARRAQVAQHAFDAGRGGPDALLEPRHRGGEARRRHGLQHVVGRAVLERRDGVLVVRGDEHDMAASARLARDLEADHARHLDVEEQHLGRMRLQRMQCGDAVAYLRRNLELGPERAEELGELLSQQRLVLSDDRPWPRHGAFIIASGGRGNSWRQTPRRADRRRSPRARLPAAPPAHAPRRPAWRGPRWRAPRRSPRGRFRGPGLLVSFANSLAFQGLQVRQGAGKAPRDCDETALWRDGLPRGRMERYTAGRFNP